MCAGFSSSLSDEHGHYSTTTSRPGTSFYCNSAGNIVYNNSVVNYTYGYPYGNIAQWTPSHSATPSLAPGAGTGSAGKSGAGGSSTSVAAAHTVTLAAGWTAGAVGIILLLLSVATFRELALLALVFLLLLWPEVVRLWNAFVPCAGAVVYFIVKVFT